MSEYWCFKNEKLIAEYMWQISAWNFAAKTLGFAEDKVLPAGIPTIKVAGSHDMAISGEDYFFRDWYFPDFAVLE